MKLPKVSCKYGAPMGRREYHTKPAGRTVLIANIPLDSGGYDCGGAYWGLGAPLYCATDGGDYREFIRAWSRAEAAEGLGITDKLKRGI